MQRGPDHITKHFRRSEFSQPARHGFLAHPAPTIYLPLLRILCEQLERIREASNGPITILSGYRSAAYNKAIGGARNSYHLRGMAADIVSPILSPLDLSALVRGLISTTNLQIRGLGLYPTFVHVDIRPGSLITWRGSRIKS